MQRGGGTRRQKDIRKHLGLLAPRIPYADAEPVIEAALAGHLRHLPPSIALWQALASHVRHRHTDYDTLLDEGYDRDAARFFVIDEMNAVLEHWGSARRVTSVDDEV
ncbi:DUF2293 domain-containing protein [Stappia sp. ES.058]|uniref:DUF2293 domain-containing protein n=1 Tax=Stappia sp. ES.058 TaxID=1881061 RepID=UPI00087ADFF7|nr:DUF2293 domain-containing protein [Stappia sp. ES.058]SDU27779.1 hypothetical protein SAMN05428979_2697 [Stappia sp. ES.058]